MVFIFNFQQNMEEEFQRCVRNMSPFAERSLPQIVKYFDEQIDSKRRSSSVTSFEDIIMLLIKRGVLDPRDSTTWFDINHACQKYVDRPFVLSPPQPPPNPPPPPPPANGLADLNPAVVRLLTSRITLSWRNFARGLDLKSIDIDEIESRCGKNYSACVTEVLKTFMDRPWASQSGKIYEDIYNAVEDLQNNALTTELKRLIGRL